MIATMTRKEKKYFSLEEVVGPMTLRTRSLTDFLPLTLGMWPEASLVDICAKLELWVVKWRKEADRDCIRKLERCDVSFLLFLHLSHFANACMFVCVRVHGGGYYMGAAESKKWNVRSGEREWTECKVSGNNGKISRKSFRMKRVSKRESKRERKKKGNKKWIKWANKWKKNENFIQKKGN